MQYLGNCIKNHVVGLKFEFHWAPIFLFAKPGNTTQKQMAHQLPDMSDDVMMRQEKRTLDYEGYEIRKLHASEVTHVLNLFPFPFHQSNPHHSSLLSSYLTIFDCLSHRKTYYLTSPGVRSWIVMFSNDVMYGHFEFSVLKDRDPSFYFLLYLPCSLWTYTSQSSRVRYTVMVKL